MTQKGQLIWRDSATGGSWYGRFYAIVEGERVRVCRALGTSNKAVARAKLQRLVEHQDASATEAKRPETFEEAARRVLAKQKAAGLATWKERTQRLEDYVFPTLGPMQPAAIRAAHILAALESVRDLGKARQTITHVKNDISSVLGDLWRSEQLTENITERVRVPEARAEATRRSKKERSVLTDAELVTYLAWQHPDEHQRMAVLERQTMACVARMFGGLRTSDLHALTWDGFDLPRILDDGAPVGGFLSGIAPRRKGSGLAKGGRPQRLAVPQMLRTILVDWWGAPRAATSRARLSRQAGRQGRDRGASMG